MPYCTECKIEVPQEMLSSGWCHFHKCPLQTPSALRASRAHTSLEKGTLPDPNMVSIPFGKYKDTPITDLPVTYLRWILRQESMEEKLGQDLWDLLQIEYDSRSDSEE